MEENETMQKTQESASRARGWMDENFANFGRCRVCGSEHLLHEDCPMCGKG